MKQNWVELTVVLFHGDEENPPQKEQRYLDLGRATEISRVETGGCRIIFEGGHHMVVVEEYYETVVDLAKAGA